MSTVTIKPGQPLQAFVDSLLPGDTGVLTPGTYSDPLSIRESNITLRSQQGRSVTRLTGQVRIERAATRAQLLALKLDARALSPLIYADDAGVAHCEITNANTDIGVHVQHYNDGVPDGVRIIGNWIHDCGGANNFDHGIYIGVATNVLVRDNVIERCGARGIQIHGKGCRVLHNTIDSNGEGVLFGTSDTPGADPASDNLVRYNIIANSKIRRNVEAFWPGAAGTGNVVRNNLLWYPQGGYYGGDPPYSGIGEQVGFTAYDNKVADPTAIASGIYGAYGARA